MERCISRSALKGWSKHVGLSRRERSSSLFTPYIGMWTSLLRLAAVAVHLRENLETLLAENRRTKMVARNEAIQEEDWTTERRAAWDAADETLENAVTLAYPKSE